MQQAKSGLDPSDAACKMVIHLGPRFYRRCHHIEFRGEFCCIPVLSVASQRVARQVLGLYGVTPPFTDSNRGSPPKPGTGAS
jgi:hypothetical protein